MKPLGRKPGCKFDGKTDCHPIPKRLIVNWWEVGMTSCCKKRARRWAKQEILKEEIEYGNR